MTPTTFDDIRPYLPEELPAAINELLADPRFRPVAEQVIPDIPFEQLVQVMRSCPTPLDIQKKIFYPLLQRLIATYTAGTTLDADAVSDKQRGCTFISNHRDIVIDPAFLCKLMIDADFRTTVEIAIGDNLLIHPWIKTLVRINKSFIVRRSVTMRQMLESSAHMSRYIHYAVTEKNENIWIAQREGRAKDSDDRTDTAILKMLSMGGEGTPAERLKALRLIPLALSYEYDPCDFLKAKEFQQKRDNPDFKKTQADDLLNMQTGIFGHKGRVHFAMGQPLDADIDALAHLPKAAFYDELAKRIDRSIFLQYRLYAGNYAAADLLRGDNTFAAHYTPEERDTFITYLRGRLALIDLPQPDEAFLWQKLLEMYANPALNQHAARAESL